MGSSRVTPAEKARFAKALAEGATVEAACQQIGRSYAWGKQYAQQIRPNTQAAQAAAQAAQSQSLRPIPYQALSPIAQDCLEDFGRFRYRYFGRISSPWQENAAVIAKDKLATPFKEYGVVNCPPGSGKSTLFTLDLPAWLTARSRTIRGFIGSSTQTMARSYVGRLRNTFGRVHPVQASSEEIALGLAADAAATLAQDYGAFRPDPTLGAPWSRDQITVAQESDIPIAEKEATWTAFGRDTEFLGWRVNFIVWDDLVTSARLRSLEVIEADRAWWDDTAETRLEPAGLLILQGQRLGPEDHYRYCLDMRMGASTDIFELEDPGDREAVQKYFHVIYKAHYEEHCKADVDPSVHKPTATPYNPSNPSEGGCLLDPIRLSWRELTAVMEKPNSKYRVVYQQEDVDPKSVLIPTHWLDGGDYEGITYPGCYDWDRGIADPPTNLTGQVFSVVTADPSPTKFWSIQWWLYVEPPGTDWLMGTRYLLDHVNKPMPAPELLDYNVDLQSWTGLLDEWHKRSQILNLPFDYLIVEKNAAQRFLLQYDWFTRWCSQSSVSILPHETMRNKLDDELGIDTLKSHYQYGRVRLPRKGSAWRNPDGGVEPLVRELTRYPDAPTDDCVMANWFFEYNLQHMVKHQATTLNVYNDIPSWLRGVPA